MSVSAHGVTVAVGSATILDGVDVTVRTGELLALVGPNGAGKSTLLGVLSGDIEPTSGEVRLEGKPLQDHKTAALARKRSVLLQEQSVAFGFRVVDIARMGRAPWAGTDSEELDDVVVADALDRGDMIDRAERRYQSLSGGEKARTMFARVLAQQTSIVFLDEPTAALDIRHQERLLTEARRLADAGHAVVAVLHDLTLAAAYSDRVCLLNDGRIAAEGTAREVFTEQRLGEVYGHPVVVVDHYGQLIVLPRREGRQTVVIPPTAHTEPIEEPSCAPAT